ncbi:fucolectin-1-like [Pelobates fuscus]|uniref:fucolectin-1-like n=1 Tax=Pelobates fuscus TaxID=191477 RepID=UPI002FE4A351
MKCLTILLVCGLCAVGGWAHQFAPKPGDTNLAGFGIVTQSSDYGIGEAIRAIDGNNDTNYFSHPCSHTNNDYEPWWKLDLRMRATIDLIIITNRQDCCAERLRGVQVKVGNSPDGNNPVCGTVTDVSQARLPIPCRGAVGRYVTVTIPGRAEYLTLCQVEVNGHFIETEHDSPAKNLAGFGIVTQSSVYGFGGAARAIDGNNDTNYHKHPCSHTNKDYEPWWKLDLKRRATIDLIVITNRQDCCTERLRGAQVKVGDSPDGNNPVCGTITDLSQTRLPIPCQGALGRYVTVTIPGRAEYLTLCQVEVYGLFIETEHDSTS